MKLIKHKDKWYLQSETGYKEILLSTDDSLIKDGIQPIPDEFLEWFVKNPSCERVDVVNDEYVDLEKDEYVDLYKIIIPKVSKPTSMENKTPMQEAIEICEAIMQNSSDTKVFETAKLIKYRLKTELLPKEEKIFVNTFIDGEVNCGRQLAQDYYNEKFNNNGN